METSAYRIDSYLTTDDHFHFARKSLAPGWPKKTHTHDFYEIFLVETGTAIHWINDGQHQLDRGNLVFMRPGDTHALTSSDEAPARIINVLFRIETAEHLALRYPAETRGRFFWTKGLEPAVIALSGPQFERATSLMLDLATAPRSLARIEAFLLTVMLRLLERPETAVGRVPDWLAAACSRAREPAVFRDGAAGFVRAAGRGHEHVCRKTKEYLGMTPSAFINRIRMEHAAQLLASDAMSVADVADDCGIENMSHFYRVFRAHFGVTPKAYRNQHQRSPL